MATTRLAPIARQPQKTCPGSQKRDLCKIFLAAAASDGIVVSAQPFRHDAATPFRKEAAMFISQTGINSTAAIAALAAALYVPFNSARAGNDVKVNNDSPGTVQNEVRIAEDFIHGAIVVAYNDRIGNTPPTPIGISFSMNGGTTWTDAQLSVPQDPFSPPGMTFPVIFDPFISFGPPDNVYAGYIATATGNCPASGLFIERSIDGGMTWFGPTMIAANPGAVGANDPNYRFNDRPTMHVSVFAQVAVVWIKDVNCNMAWSDVYYASSFPPPGPPMPGNTGLSFAAPVTVNDNPNGTDMANVPDVKIHPNGFAYVVWIDVNVTGGNPTTGTIKLDRTIEPFPVNFGPDINVITIDPAPATLSNSSGVATSGGGSYPVIALDEFDGSGQTIYMAYSATPQPFVGDEADIYFIKSTDSGQTWTAPLRVNDDNSMTDQTEPVIGWHHAGGSGVIVIGWYDKRNCANDDRWDVYMTRSVNGGASFAPNRLVTNQTFVSPQASNNTPWMGEYMGLTIDQSSTAHFAFTSSVSDIRGDIYYDRVPNNVVKSADIDNSGAVNVADLLAVIAAWGPCVVCQSCPADVNGDGTVNVADLLAVINQWG
jgi:hypothetical protein